MATTRVTAPPGMPFVEVEREFDAPRDLVYRAWTEPDADHPLAGPAAAQDAHRLLGPR